MNKPHTIMEDEVLVAWNKRSARKPQQTPKVPSYVGEVIAVTSHIQTYAQNEIEKLLATALEEQRMEYQSQIDHKNKTIEQMMEKIRYLRSSQPERRKPIVRIKNGDRWYIPMITQAHDTPDGLYIEAELAILNGKDTNE